MAKGIVEHFIFEVKHYNKILNGSRSYYLARSQPPFLTDMALQIYNQLDRSDLEANRQWLKRGIQAAIKEYHTIWVAEPRVDPKTGLSRYRPEGVGIPPETEATHFTHILEPYAAKHGLSVNEFSERYNNGTIREPELDEYSQILGRATYNPFCISMRSTSRRRSARCSTTSSSSRRTLILHHSLRALKRTRTRTVNAPVRAHRRAQSGLLVLISVGK